MSRSYWLRITLPLCLALIIAVRLVSTAAAAEFTHDGIIEAGEVVNDDLFINTDIILVDGVVNGDLFINSNIATINGEVNGNLIASVAILNINGPVNGSVVFLGKSLLINSKVSGTVYGAGNQIVFLPGTDVTRNVFLAGFSVESKPEARIGRDLFFTGYQAKLYGDIDRDLHVDLGGLEAAGKIGRDAYVIVGPPEKTPEIYLLFPQIFALDEITVIESGLNVKTEAEIGGKFTYYSSVEQRGRIHTAPFSGVAYEFYSTEAPQPEEAQSFTEAAGIWARDRVRDLVTLLIVGVLGLWRFPGVMNRAMKQASGKILPATGWGLVTVLIGYGSIALIGLAVIITSILIGVITLDNLTWTVVSVGFAGLGFAVAVFSVLVAYVSKLVIALLAGRLILSRVAPKFCEHSYLPMVIGIVLYVLLRSIPFAGVLISILVTLAGVGAMWMAFRAWREPCTQVVTPAIVAEAV